MGEEEEMETEGRKGLITNNTGKEGEQREQQEEKEKNTQNEAGRHRGCEASCKGWSWRWVQKIYGPGKAIKRRTKNTSGKGKGNQGSRSRHIGNPHAQRK